MNRALCVITVSSVSFLLLPTTKAQGAIDSTIKKDASAPTITITKLNVTDKTLELRYEITNVSGQDAWILAGFGEADVSASVFMDEDDRTLLISRRLDVPASSIRGPFPFCDGRYVRLPAGQTQAESVSLVIPVLPEYGPAYGLAVGLRRKAPGLEYATRLTIEIGYYTRDLPDTIRRVLEEDQKKPRIIRAIRGPDGYDINTISGWFGGLLGFNALNELVRSRDDEVLIPYTSQAFTDEQVLHVKADDLHIPYEEADDHSERRRPDLTGCTRVEIRYQPSMLEYFFPYAWQQSILSPEEKQYLQSGKTVVVDNPDNLMFLTDEVRWAHPEAGIVRQRSAAYVVCYRDNEHLTSFPIYNDDCMVEGRYLFRLRKGFQSLTRLTPHVRAIEQRVQCAENLKHLWHRFRLYDKAAESLRFAFLRRLWRNPYPPPDTWCDSMLRAYRRAIEISHENLIRPYICPSVGQGKCHYAMNPNCKPNSPPDAVLLFETKAGWNQHGGPELFTFDNHDPKGGCVLLNDGTVKFIRTTEELQQLRWK
jgi:hypothetical protein